MIPLLNLKEKTVFEKNLHIRFSFAPVAKMAIFAFFQIIEGFQKLIPLKVKKTS